MHCSTCSPFGSTVTHSPPRALQTHSHVDTQPPRAPKVGASHQRALLVCEGAAQAVLHTVVLTGHVVSVCRVTWWLRLCSGALRAGQGRAGAQAQRVRRQDAQRPRTHAPRVQGDPHSCVHSSAHGRSKWNGLRRACSDLPPVPCLDRCLGLWLTQRVPPPPRPPSSSRTRCPAGTNASSRSRLL